MRRGTPSPRAQTARVPERPKPPYGLNLDMDESGRGVRLSNRLRMTEGGRSGTYLAWKVDP